MEFTLVVPILIILVVAVADFGRIFAAGVVVEAATRDAAEVAAFEYLASPPGDLASPAPTPGDSVYYAALHEKAAKVACAEMRSLPGTQYDGSTQTCSQPVIRVCVHDSADPVCGQAIAGFASTVPPECDQLSGGWSTADRDLQERFVEVRTCYEFVSLIRVPLVSFGTFYLERVRNFTIPCYFRQGGEAPCG